MFNATKKAAVLYKKSIFFQASNRVATHDASVFRSSSWQMFFKKVLWKILQNSQKSTCARVSVLVNKVGPPTGEPFALGRNINPNDILLHCYHSETSFVVDL